LAGMQIIDRSRFYRACNSLIIENIDRRD